MKRLPLLFLIVAGVASTGCHRTLNNNGVRLRWLGDSDDRQLSKEMRTAIRDRNFGLAEVMDRRVEPDAIGHYEEERVVVTTPDNVSEFLNSVLVQQFQHAGIRFVATGADFVFLPELLRYEVNEGGKYQAHVELRLSVLSQGAVIWSAMVPGNGSTWGKTHSHENLNQALSEATDDFINRVLKDPRLVQAIATH